RSALVVPRAFLCENRQPRVHDLHNIVWAGREAIVRWVAVERTSGRRLLRTFESNAEPVEALDQWRGRPFSLRCLLHCCAGWRNRRRRRRLTLLRRVLVIRRSPARCVSAIGRSNL